MIQNYYLQFMLPAVLEGVIVSFLRAWAVRNRGKARSVALVPNYFKVYQVVWVKRYVAGLDYA